MKLREVADRVVVDVRKLLDYALNPDAPWGHHKAMIFERILGFTRENYADLLAQIESNALGSEAIFHSEDEYGRRYTVDLMIQGTEGRKAIVRTGWLVPPGADEAHLITLYVRKPTSDS